MISKQSIKVLIAAGMVMLATNALAGCTPDGEVSEVGAERIAAAQEMRKTVSLLLTEAEVGEDIVVRLVLDNSEKKPVTSVQAWLTYNPDVLKGVSIDTKNSAFELMAPYDNDFDHEAGLMMLGRSSATPVEDEEITIAEIHFERVGEGAAMIEAYDYRQDLTGHTSANMMLDGVPMNILLKPQSPLLIIEAINNPL